MTDSISYKDTGYFSNVICDYLDQKESIRSYYGNFSNLEGFKNQIRQKKNSFTANQRAILHHSLLQQYEKVNATPLTKRNLNTLKEANTFCITTGHQLNLFTGPLYFLYKIIGTINLAKQLKESYPEENFVPIYWMATEDHDFEEIQYFNFNGAKISWNNNGSGPVGRFNTNGLNEVLTEFSKLMGKSKQAQYLIDLFKQSYLSHAKLTDAHRFLVNELFGDQGLVIIDGDDIGLKQSFGDHIKNELVAHTSYHSVNETIENLKTEYDIQVNPREINLFYIKDGFRERIVMDGAEYATADQQFKWSKEAILSEVDANPERFSPNVIMRPLFQEFVLPNLCYIGGGGELAYWFQLKAYFDQVQVPFPILLLRNSVLCISAKQKRKMAKLNLSIPEIFLNTQALIKRKTKELSKLDIDFSTQRAHLEKQFLELEKLAEQTDKSFIGAVKAQKVKQIKGLNHLEKRLLKAEKRKLKEVLDRIKLIQNELFPNGSLEERYKNFSELYLEFGPTIIENLSTQLDPLDLRFSLIHLDED